MIKPSGNSVNGNSAFAHLYSINIYGLSQRSHMLLDKYVYDKDIMLLAVLETRDLSNSRYKYLNNMNTFEDTNQKRNKGRAIMVKKALCSHNLKKSLKFLILLTPCGVYYLGMARITLLGTFSLQSCSLKSGT